jgi:RHS repeat-associated protein
LAYDAASRITQLVNGDGSSSYSYDNRNQVTAADHTLVGAGLPTVRPDEAFAYDANGNRTSSSLHGSAYRTGPGNRLSSDGTYNYVYDDEGNLSRRTEIATGKAFTFLYDHRNRLTLVSDLDAAGNLIQQTQFRYDPRDRRIEEALSVPATDGSGQFDVTLHQYVYFRENVLLEFKSQFRDTAPQPATFERRNLHGPLVDQVFAQDAGGASELWLLADHLGSTTDLVNDSGTIQNHITYDSFGQVISQSNPAAATRYLFTGREFNSDLELYYYRARFYDPAVGRFLSEDPVGFLGDDVNLFRYVGNDPLAKGDPSGLLTYVRDDPTAIALTKKAAQTAAREATRPYAYREATRPYAVIESIEGDVGLRTADVDWDDAAQGQWLSPTDEIHTGPGSKAVIRFRDGQRITAKELTQVAIGQMRGDADNPKIGVLVKMAEVMGKAANHPENELADFSVHTPESTCAVRG